VSTRIDLTKVANRFQDMAFGRQAVEVWMLTQDQLRSPEKVIRRGMQILPTFGRECEDFHQDCANLLADLSKIVQNSS
jgi:hypothetical protein